MEKVEVMVLVADTPDSKLPELQKKLAAAGLTRIARMESIGAITGIIEESKIDKVQRIPGVLQVEKSSQVQIAPPDSAIQ